MAQQEGVKGVELLWPDGRMAHQQGEGMRLPGEGADELSAHPRGSGQQRGQLGNGHGPEPRPRGGGIGARVGRAERH